MKYNYLETRSHCVNTSFIIVECRTLFLVMLSIIMLNVIMLTVVMLIVVMLSVIMLSVVAPKWTFANRVSIKIILSREKQIKMKMILLESAAPRHSA
jgi:hypothetical protein